jgi:hypothetical protein
VQVLLAELELEFKAMLEAQPTTTVTVAQVEVAAQAVLDLQVVVFHSTAVTEQLVQLVVNMLEAKEATA